MSDGRDEKLNVIFIGTNTLSNLDVGYLATMLAERDAKLSAR